MLRRIAVIVLLALPVLADTVFLFSMDGLGHQIFQQAPLPTLKRLAARGTMADGIQPAFPSTTANSHAALWTGAYGDVSNIAANSQPLLPRAEHTFRERNNGYRADQLAAEPLWVTAARQGVKTVAYQAPQAFPFLESNTHPAALSINGYQTRQVAPHKVLRRKDLKFLDASSFEFQHGAVTFRGSVTGKGLRIGGVEVRYAPAENGHDGRRELARRFSKGLWVDSPVPAVVYFRLFEFSKDDLLLYVSPIQEMGMSHGDALALLRGAGGFIGNTYQRRELSDAQSLETAELLARQNARHSAWLQRTQKPGMFIGYLPVADELGHQYLGAALKGEAAAKASLTWGWGIIERWSQEIAKMISRRDHVILTADHGMAPTYKAVNVNEVLRRAGLADQAVHIYNSVLFNTTDFKRGTVADREAMRIRVQNALSAVRDPEPVFTAFFTPAQDGARFGIGGPAGSDLYFDMRPGYTVRDVPGELFPALDRQGGNHGFRPDREDMLAVLFAAGPRIPKGAAWGRLKSIDVAPLACALLGIDPPRHSVGKSPLPRTR